MYHEFFNLREHPFGLTPDADYLYLSPLHARAKAAIEQAGSQRDALVVVTGDVGCGKSILVNRVMAEMPPDVAVARLTLTNLDSEEFLQSVLSQYGCRPFERSRDKLMGLLDNFLFAQNVRERPVVLIIEEAQNLSKKVLDVVLDLANLEEDSEKLISIVLIGQPSLQERLQSRELRKIASRVSCSVRLEPLSQNDTTRLITHRLKIAGCDESPFDAETYPEIYGYTGGVPRLIVNLCDTAMTAAYVEESPRVTTAILDTAIEELELERVAEPDPDLLPGEDTPAEDRQVSLVVKERGEPRGELVLSDTRIMIGRDSDNDVTLVSEYISRHHAQIVMDHDGRFWVKDLNSTNGIFVNGKKTKRTLLHGGDRIILGHHELVFCDTAEATGERGSSSELSEWRETMVFGQSEDEDQADSA